jgi:hypothetical protein
MLEAADLGDASATSTVDLADVAGTTGETTQLLESQTLTHVTESVAPTPTGSMLDLGSTEQTSTQTSAGTTRDPVQEAQGQETVTGTTDAQIRIVIQRPEGEE